MLVSGAAQNGPLALALIWAFQRIETKLDKIAWALVGPPPRKGEAT